MSCIVSESFYRPISASKMVYDFCKANGICVTCRIRDAQPRKTQCARCAQYNVKHSTKSHQKTANGKPKAR